MPITFDPISSPDATRDLFVDLTAALEPGEQLTTVTLVSAHPTLLSVSNVAINDAVVSLDDAETAVGQGVHFTVSTLQASRATLPLTLRYTGDSGSADTYEILQPIVMALCE